MRHVGDIQNIVVVGTGMMGPGIALSLARGGFSVALYGRTEASLQRGEANFTQCCERLVEHGLAEQGEIDAARRRITLTDDLPTVAGQADMIIESIVEDLVAKRETFSTLCTFCSPETILTSNTSGLSITRIAKAVSHPARFIGTHFWNPPYLMPLVEVVKGEQTTDKVMDLTCAVIQRTGKRPIRVWKDIPGFLGNRLQHALWREALALVEHGVATPEDVDTMVKYSFSLRMPPIGVFEYMDMVGIDLVHSIHSYLFAELDKRTTPSPVTAELLRNGRLGIKTGRGFYTWTGEKAEQRKKKRDEEVIRQLRLNWE